jgi:spore maturation protein CgeB
MQGRSSIRYLIAYSAYDDQRQAKYERLLERHRSRGLDFEGFCVTPPALNQRQWLPFDQLDRRWRKNDRALLTMYAALEEKLRLKDVFIVFNGANVHPNFLRNLSTFNVYICWDDPESSELLSRPVAHSFDYCFTGNASCVPLYQSWGIKKVDFLPYLFFTEEDYDPCMTERHIFEENRDIDVVFLGENNQIRAKRLERLMSSFPGAVVRGRRWPGGYLAEEEKLRLYRHTRIGWNIHNSVGPCNARTFALPSNGILQICDNRSRLGQLFELGSEVVGFDEIEECVELTKYYLEHDRERKEIAVNGWRRFISDYNEPTNWRRMLDLVEPHIKKHMEPMGRQTNSRRAELFSTQLHGRVDHPTVSVIKWVKKALNRVGYDIMRLDRSPGLLRADPKGRPLPYRENPEVGPVNWKDKEGRVREDGFFEWPNMVALNYAVASMVGSYKSIIEIGGGTGVFAYEASTEKNRHIVCCEDDKQALDYARIHRSRANVIYTSQEPASIEEKFELVVSIEVIEHIQDFRAFLELCCRLAPNAILTTPNKSREKNHRVVSGPPINSLHVREWTAGEFYWILRAFYKQVELYSMPDPYIPSIVPVNVSSTMTPLLAVCRSPVNEHLT